MFCKAEPQQGQVEQFSKSNKKLLGSYNLQPRTHFFSESLHFSRELCNKYVWFMLHTRETSKNLNVSGNVYNL